MSMIGISHKLGVEASVVTSKKYLANEKCSDKSLQPIVIDRRRNSSYTISSI